MSHRDRISEFIRCFPGRNDDEISSVLKIKPRQTVNQNCRALEKSGQIERRPDSKGKICNYPKHTHQSPQAINGQPLHAVAPAASHAAHDWYWEGNVVEAVASFLERQGWSLISKADTLSKQRGIDLKAERDGRVLDIEAKGYPSTKYRDPARAGEAKRTNPTVQAHHWYAQAFLKAVRMRAADRSAFPAIALPDFPRYRTLFSETADALKLLEIGVMFVGAEGDVECFHLDCL